MAEEQEIRDGERVAAFLADPAVQAAFERLDKRLYEQFKTGKNPAAREAAWAQASALAMLQTELKATISNGEMAAHARTVRERGTRR